LTPGAIVEARVTGVNTGGLECTVNKIRGFIPASQVALYRVEQFNDFVDQRLQCVVTEANPDRQRLVLSRRAVLEREQAAKREELLKSIQPGQTLDGVVTKIMDFGAFVDVGGLEGLVHVSKLSWDRVTNPGEVLKVGEKIKVKVEKIAEGSGKLSLSYRDTLQDPWENIEQKYPTGSVVRGTVSRIAQFGAFVKLEPGIEGLIHVSELAHHRVFAVKNIVNEGDEVEVKVLSIDRPAQRMSLSLKATQAKPEPKSTGKKEVEEVDAPPRPVAVPSRNEPLKGGRDRKSGGEGVGLNW
jgi:small subunit ribosomal protein S1